MIAFASAATLAEIPSVFYPPKCSIDENVLAAFPESAVINVTDGAGRARCVSAVVPKKHSNGGAPILFYAHGAGGSCANFGAKTDTSGTSWSSLVEKYGFGFVGVEAVQWSAPGPGPAPAPVPPDCVNCFAAAGCTPGTDCTSCMQKEKSSCAHVCGAEHVPFPSVEAAVCGSSALVELAYQWHGGEWLIPEIQNDTTGLMCDWSNDAELVYIDNVVDALGAFRGGGVFDTSRVFFTGCSMGSALTGWLSQCYHAKYPSASTAFCTQSTGLKVKGDGLEFPPDNYADGATTWGECAECKYFPAPVVKTRGLKACFVDQTADPSEHEPYFYKSTLAMQVAWGEAGMRSNASYTSGGHCQTASYQWIVDCMDDGTGRLLGQQLD